MATLAAQEVWGQTTDWRDAVGNIATAIAVAVAIIAIIASTVITLRSEKVVRQGQVNEQLHAEATTASSEAMAALAEEYTSRGIEA